MRWNRIVMATVALLLAGCAGGAASTPTLLPTATPEPTQMIPTPTSTRRPPPTVTPFPTLPGAGDSAAPSGITTTAAASAPPAAPAVPSEPPTATSQPPTATTAPSTAVSTWTPRPPTLTFTPTLTATRAPSATPTATATRIAPPGVEIDERLYRADFYQGWPTVSEDGVRIYLSGGVYLFEVGPRNDGFMTTGSLTHQDFYSSVEVTPRACAAQSGFGLRFRFVDAGNYYALTVWCDDTYTVTEYANDHARTLPGGGALPEPLGEDTHKIAVTAVGDQFAVYFDNVLLGTFEDDTFPEGDMAMFAVSQSAGVVSVAFDNLEVWSLR